ncbi:NAD(P)-dependent dehydrogenase, short-chain alcohol dehydrogenase family [Cohaesibacter sp. ES.047]|uniref:SDR family oxidoreductase n=1 Tax=Cohaesibacter sp. ES.047 TaxID=1798205 RepID=UPI000BB6868F|nr:SDR family oxidoreductase [Cohaesibacter sp. ES.047]SNY92946.1 NAD(P)-dependent dehydrogenase, short-chain alcohol dehydrogenase family [Cohaesibacter sp. ES.047]
MDFNGKTVLITGAGKGIGRATARTLASRGAKIVGFSRSLESLEGLTEETGAKCITADFSDAAEVRRAMKEAGTADYLVNCAGTNVLETVLDLSDRGLDAVLHINLRAAIICAQEFAKARVAAGGGGVILNITSIAGHRGFDEHVAYAASKAGLEGATRVLAKELGPHGIRAVCLAPTITMTELAAVAWSDPVKSEPMMVRHPSGRFAEPEDVAKAVAMLLSDDACMVNGSVLAVDGGFLAV